MATLDASVIGAAFDGCTTKLTTKTTLCGFEINGVCKSGVCPTGGK